MFIKIINDDEDVIQMKLYRYDLEKIEQEDTERGVYHIEDKWKLYVPVGNILKDFIKKSYDMVIIIYFDDCEDGRTRKIISPSVEIFDKYIYAEKLNTYTF